METTKIELFVKIAELGNLTLAAKTLGYTQSGASHILSSLEEELGGIMLFKRGRGGSILTPEGEKLLKCAQEIQYWQNNLQLQAQEIVGKHQRTLRIAGFPSVCNPWIPKILLRFREKYPGVEFETMISDYRDAEEWIASGRADCGFVRMPLHKALQATLLISEPMLVVLPQDHPLAGHTEISLKELDNEQFIRPSENRFLDVSAALKNAGIGLYFRYTVSNYRDVLDLVESGLGLSVMPRLTYRMRPSRTVARPVAEGLHREIGIATRRQKNLPVLVQRFIATVVDMVRSGELE